MKNVWSGIALSAIVFSSCEQKELQSENRAAEIKSLQEQSVVLATNHDYYVAKMLQAEKNYPSLGVDNRLEIIREVTGVKPVIMGNDNNSRAFMAMKVGQESYPVIDLDAGQINLSDFSESAELLKYLVESDKIIQDSTLFTDEKVSKIKDVQNKALSDENLSTTDIQKVLNATEIAKGSLVLWDQHIQSQIQSSNILGLQRSTPMKEWGFWSKLGFVSAADAVGGVLGFWFGGFIVVGGVTMWVPPGPAGVAASAAGISYIAAKMVGW